MADSLLFSLRDGLLILDWYITHDILDLEILRDLQSLAIVMKCLDFDCACCHSHVSEYHYLVS
jgi:hypothetical protein